MSSRKGGYEGKIIQWEDDFRCWVVIKFTITLNTTLVGVDSLNVL